MWSKRSALGKDDTTWGVKRKTCLDSLTPIKRKRLSESDDPTTSKECFNARVKRKATEEGEGKPMKEKKGRLDLNLFGKESASSSKHYGKESCNTSVEDVRVGKRKATADDEGPRTKKKRRTDLKKTRQSVYGLRESCNTSVEDVRVGKRKAAADDEGPRTKKKRTGLKKTRQSVYALRESCNTSVEDGSVGKRKATADDEGPKTNKKRRTYLKKTSQSVYALRAEFGAKYKQQDQLGKGGFGTVFDGYCKADNLPVAIKHIPKKNIHYDVDETGKKLPMEVAIMLKLTDTTSRSVGMSAPVSLLDWYDLNQELILVMERPIPAEDLRKYIQGNRGFLIEEEAKIILKQLVDAAIDLEEKNIFHRDIKCENILIETSSDVPRVRLIDFGVSRFVKRRASYRIFRGTPAYSPPEWCNRRRYRAGPTTVWQIGVVLYEILHSDATFNTNMFLRNLVGISGRLSEDCQDFLRRCFTMDPKKRPTLEQLRIHPWLRKN